MKRRTLLQAIAAFFASLVLGLKGLGGRVAAVPRLVAQRFNGGVSPLARWRPVTPPKPLPFWEGSSQIRGHVVMEMLRPARSAPVRVGDDAAFEAAIQDVMPSGPPEMDPVTARVYEAYARENGYDPEVIGAIPAHELTEAQLEYERLREENLREFLNRIKQEKV